MGRKRWVLQTCFFCFIFISCFFHPDMTHGWLGVKKLVFLPSSSVHPETTLCSWRDAKIQLQSPPTVFQCHANLYHYCIKYTGLQVIFLFCSWPFNTKANDDLSDVQVSTQSGQLGIGQSSSWGMSGSLVESVIFNRNWTKDTNWPVTEKMYIFICMLYPVLLVFVQKKYFFCKEKNESSQKKDTKIVSGNVKVCMLLRF